MNEIITSNRKQFPETLPDLSRFVLIGRDKLKAVRAEIHAIDKVGMAKEVYQQKLEEAQEIAEVVTDAECRMGELLKAIPKAGNGKLDSHRSEIPKSKMQTVKESGITQRQAEHFQYMASHPESVERAKAKAREQGVVLSRSAVINQIVSDTKPKNPIREMERQAEERHEEFNPSAKTVSFDDIRQDKEDRVTIGRRAYIEICNSVKALDAYALLKNESVKAIPDALEKTKLEHFRMMLMRASGDITKILVLMEGKA